jgi:virginiamycin B lyase
MSEVVTPSISISELATTLRSAISADQQLLLSKSTVDDPAWSGYLFGLLEVEALLLAAAQVSDIEGGFCVTGRASFLTLTNLDVALTVTALDSGLGLSLRATPAGGFSALAGRVAGLDLQSLLPAGLGELLMVRELNIAVGKSPYLAFTLASTQPWNIVPNAVSIESAEVFIGVRMATTSSPLSVSVRPKALLRIGTNSMPIVLTKNESTAEWELRLDGAEVLIPGLTDLAQLFGGAELFEAMMPGLGSFGALTLTDLQLRVDLARRVVSSMSFDATAQSEWTLPLFGQVAFGRPTVSLAVQGLGLPSSSAAATDRQVPYLAFKLASAQTWEPVPGFLSIDGVELFIGVFLPTANRPRKVGTRLEAAVRVGSVLLPIALGTDPSTAEWTLSLDSPQIQLPSLSDLAQFFGGANLESLMPGLGNFGELVLTGLELRLDPARRTISSFSFGACAKDDWTLPLVSDMALRQAAISLNIVSPSAVTRAVTGSMSAVVAFCGREFQIAARKDVPTDAWRLIGQQVSDLPMSITTLANELLAGALPAGMPELSFAEVGLSLTPATGEFSLSGRSSAPWVVPLGLSDLTLSNVKLTVNRTLVGGVKRVSLQLGADLAVGNVAVSLGLNLPGGFVLSAALPAVKLSDLLQALGASALLTGLGLPDSFLNFTLGSSTITIDVPAKSASIRGAAPGFGALELQIRRDPRGAFGAALALKPQAGVNLQTLLGVPGLGGFELANLVFVLSSIYDPALRFVDPAFASVGTVTRGFGFSTTVTIASLGLGSIPGLPTAPIAMQARFGRTLADFSLSAALSQPGGRFILDPSSGLALIDPELRLSPALGEVGVVGKLECTLDSQKLTFIGGFKVVSGAAVLFATMPGAWERPFGISGLVASNLSLELRLPGLPSLAGTLQLGRQSGALMIKPDPTAPVLDLRLDNLDLNDLLRSVCDPALANVPPAFRQTITDIRISNARVYVAPRDTTIGDIPCAAGVTVSGNMTAWGLNIDARVQTVGSGPLKALSAEGSVALPDLGGLLALKGSGGRALPYFKLDLRPGQVPVVIINARVEVMGTTTSSVDIELNDAGFKLEVSGPLFGRVQARLQISGGRLAPSTKYAVAAELDATPIQELLVKVQQKLGAAVAGATSEIDRAQRLLTDTERKAVALTQAAENQRKQIQAARDQDAARLRKAESDMQQQSAQVDALLRSLEQARATVLSERAEVDRRIAAAQRDVNAANSAVTSINNEINGTNRWFYGLPKIDVPWKASQAREGAWFGIKMGALYTAQVSTKEGLAIANRALQAIQDTQNSFSVDLDPRVAGILASYASAKAVLDGAMATLTTLRNSIQLIPIDADFRMVALASLQQAQTVQLVAARSALDLAKTALNGIATLGASLVPSVLIRRAYFSGELSMLQGGKVRLGLELSTSSGVSAFTIGFDLNDPLSAATELVNCLLGTDSDKSIAAVAQSTSTAATTILQVEQEVLPANQIVTIRSGQNGQLLRVMGNNPIRFGDTISVRAANGNYLVAENTGVVNADRGAIGEYERWVVVNSFDPGSTNFVRYGDTVSLRSWRNTYLAGNGDTMNANSSAIGQVERWVLLCASDLNRRDDVDTNLPFALRNGSNSLLGAWNGGGSGTFAWNPTVGAWETWALVSENSWALSGCLVASGTSSLDPACQFQLKRNGEWIGFLSQLTDRYVIVYPDLSVRANSTNFVNPAHTWEKFRLEASALFSQGHLHYLHISNTAANAPLMVDAGSTVRGDLSNMFVIQKAFEVSFTVSGAEPPRQPTANDQTTSVQQKSALAGSTAAIVGSDAERDAANQATQAGQGGLSLVEPARLALAQAEADRRARRQRANEKAARGSRPASAGSRDSALRFDGQSYLEAPASRAALRATTDTASVQAVPYIVLGTKFTVEAWVYPEAVPGDHASILSKWRGDIEDELLLSIASDGRLTLSWHLDGASVWGTPGWSQCQSAEPVKLEAWSHVAAVRDGDAVSLYIDGRRVGGAAGLGTAALRVGMAAWRIGAQGNGTRYFAGMIDSIRIWDQAQSAAMLRAQRFLLATGTEPGLLACWNFDEESGDTTYDSGPLELHARLSSGVQRVFPGGPDGPSLPDRHLTLVSKAHAVVGNFDLFAGSTALAIEAWVRVERIGEEFTSLLSKWAQGPDDEFLFGLGSTGKLVFGWHTQGGSAYGTPGWNHLFSDGTVPLGRWCHVAVVRDGKAIRFYCDGEPTGASTSCDELPLRRGGVPIYIGSERGQGRYFEGSLAELRVWRRALSSDEVRDNYRRPLTGDESGLGALWLLDEGGGSVLRDAVPAGHSGKLVGSAWWPALGGPPRVIGPTQGLRLSGNQYVEFGDDDLFTASVAMTIESWVRVDAITEDFTSIVNKWTQSLDCEYLFGLMPDGRLSFAWHTQGGDTYNTASFGPIFSEQKIKLGRFTHVAVVRAGSGVAFYIDGQAAGSFECMDLAPFRNSAAPLRIGAEGNGTGRFFRGTLANLRIWRVARSSAQLVAGMQGLVSSREAGRVLDLRFDEGEGVTVLDVVSGQVGRCVGTPQFVPITLPLRKQEPRVESSDPWRQSAQDAASYCRDTGIPLPDALGQVEAALAQLERPTPSRLITLLARAGYTAQAIGTACVQAWGYDATKVAGLYFAAERPAAEALLAIDAALSLAGRSSQAVAAALASASGYAAEAIGLGLRSAWGQTPQAVARTARDAGLACGTAAGAVWAALDGVSLQSLVTLVGYLVSAGYPAADISTALTSSWGCDVVTSARALERAVIAAAPPLDLTLLREVYAELWNSAPVYYFSFRPEAEANGFGWKRLSVAFVAFSASQPGTVPIYCETPLDNSGVQYHFSHRTAEEAAKFGWKQAGVAFHAFKTPQPGTVAVFREQASGKYYFSVRDKSVAALCGWQQQDVAFYAYPPDKLDQPAEISLRAYGGQFVAVDSSDGRTVAARRDSLGGWERFARIDLGQGRIALRASNGKFVRAEGGGGGAVTASAPMITAFETFNLIDCGTGTIALQSSSGQYVGAEGGSGQPLLANRSAIGGWESFACVLQPTQLAWTSIPGSLKYVACAGDGTVWGVNSSDNIFRWLGGGWEQIPGSLKQVSVGSATQIWGVNSSDNIFRWTGSGWVQVAGGLKHVAVAADGTVWGVNSSDNIFRWLGGGWEHIPGSLSQISVGAATQVWGVNSGGNIFRWLGGGWELVPGLLKHVSVAADGTVWGVTTANAVVRWRGGAQWEALDANLKQVGVGSRTVQWGVTATDQIVRSIVKTS